MKKVFSNFDTKLSKLRSKTKDDHEMRPSKTACTKAIVYYDPNVEGVNIPECCFYHWPMPTL